MIVNIGNIMIIYDYIALFFIMAALAMIPSSSVALVVARTVSSGLRNGIAVAAGIVLGDLIFIVLAIFSLSTIIEVVGGLFVLVKYAGGLYLIWLGLNLIFPRTKETVVYEDTNGSESLLISFLAGLLLTLGDLKALFFYLSLFPFFVQIDDISSIEILIIGLMTILCVGGAKLFYAVYATRIARKVSKGKYYLRLRKSIGSLIIGTGGYILVKT